MSQTLKSFRHHGYLDAYHPRIPGPVWEWMRSFTLDLVSRSVQLSTDPRQVTAQRALTALTGYLDWARQAGFITSPDQGQSRRLIELYSSQRITSVKPICASRERSILLVLFDVQDVPVPTQGLGLVAEAPYLEPDIDLIRAWASYQATDRRTKNCAAIASFGLGCGLTVTEMMNVRGSHIIELSDGEMGVVVRHGKERIVPALTAWSPWLRRVRTSTNDDEFVIAPGTTMRDSRAMNYLRYKTHGEITPVPLRLRNTWLVTQLDARTPLDIIARASGAHYAGFPTRLEPFVRTYSAAEELAFLRGPNAQPPQEVTARA